MLYKKFFWGIVFIFLASVLCLTANANYAQAQTNIVSPPLIIGSTDVSFSQPLIIGLTPANTNVYIFIDKVKAGTATVNQEGTTTNNFYYRPDKALSAGEHEIMVLAEDQDSFLLSAPTVFVLEIKPLPAPTLIVPNENTVTAKVKPLITGLTISNSLVHVYIDGVYNGHTEIKSDSSGTANFAYKPFLNLSPGQHMVWAISEDGFGNKSQVSASLNFNIELPLPAPVIFQPQGKTNQSKPLITGVVKNKLAVRVFIDYKLNGEFGIVDHSSGTANFAYEPFLPLTNGRHVVYTTSIDSRGKESSWSNIIYFEVVVANIGPEAESAENKEISQIEEPQESPEEIINISPENGNTDAEVEEITTPLNLDTNNNKTEREEIVGDEEEASIGLVNENQQASNKIKLNLIIFIGFLLGIIVWIFWVNRELIREKRNKQILKKDGDENKDPNQTDQMKF